MNPFNFTFLLSSQVCRHEETLPTVTDSRLLLCRRCYQRIDPDTHEVVPMRYPTKDTACSPAFPPLPSDDSWSEWTALQRKDNPFTFASMDEFRAFAAKHMEKLADVNDENFTWVAFDMTDLLTRKRRRLFEFFRAALSSKRAADVHELRRLNAALSYLLINPALNPEK